MGMVVQAFTPSSWEAEAGRSMSSKVSQGYIERPCFKTKKERKEERKGWREGGKKRGRKRDGWGERKKERRKRKRKKKKAEMS